LGETPCGKENERQPTTPKNLSFRFSFHRPIKLGATGA